MKLNSSAITGVNIGSTAISKVYKGNALYWLALPAYSDTVSVWDGTIIQSEGNYYLKDKKGIADLLITDYDFPTGWVKGVPYKSKATLSAPAANATLIAADVNNFFYDTGGTPKQIPAQLFYQNVDYAGRLFSKHNSQEVVTFPIESTISGIYEDYDIETQAASLQEIVLYANTKTGDDLVKCNNYFDVPVKQTTNIREVGSGKTYSTISAAITAASAGDTIYVYSGDYVENVSCSKANIKFVGLGNVTIKPIASQSYSLQISGAGCSVTGIRVLGNTTTYGFMCLGSGLTLNKCYFDYISTRTVWYRGAGNLTAEYCVLLGGICYTNAFVSNFGANSNYIDNLDWATGAISCFGSYQTNAPTANTTFKVNHNRIKMSKPTALSNIVTAYGDLIDIYDNKFEINIVTDPFNDIVSSTKFNYHFNTFTANSGYHSLYFDNAQFNNIYISDLGDYTSNRFKFRATPIEGRYSLKCSNNIIRAKRVDLWISQFNTSDYSVFFDNNRIESYYAPSVGEGYTISTYMNSVDDREWKLYFRNNIVLNPRYHDPDIEFSAHCCLYLWQMKRFDVKNNYLAGSDTVELITKSGQATTTNAVDAVIRNNYISGTESIVFKGISNIKFYQNTCIVNIADFVFETPVPVVDCIIAESGATTENIEVKNNILVNNNSNILVKHSILTTVDDFQFQGNLYYSSKGAISNYFKGVSKNFAQWQALGFDANGVEQNPNLVDDLYPETPFEIGEDLGEDYDEGLDVTTNWGDSDSVPVVVEKQQGANWQVGAYVQD